MTNLNTERPDPADYADYRAYLREMTAFLKATQRRFSYRFFSEKAGFSSPNFLKLVADGKRNLSEASVRKFSRALDHTHAEAAVFRALVLFNQAKADDEKNRFFAELKSRCDKGSVAHMNKAQYDVYSTWPAVPVREVVGLPDFVEDAGWIAKRLFPKVGKSVVKGALSLLEEVGLLTRDKEGRLVRASPKLAAVKDIQSLAVRNYHRKILQLAADSLTKLSPAERNVTSVTVAMSPQQYEATCERIAAVREELLDAIEDGASSDDAREIYVLGFQVFPISRKDTSK